MTDRLARIAPRISQLRSQDYFKTRALAVADSAGPGPRWFVTDAIPASQIDITGLYALRDLREKLQARGAALILAAEFLIWLREAGLHRPEHETSIFPTLRRALKAYQREMQQYLLLADDDI